MSDIKLTGEQQAAVENRGGSLLVSAAAGSGKTKVLVERLFSYVADGGADLTDFLIITYTKAAAAELRGKIAAELTKRIAAAPDDRHLQRQTMLVYKADIKTVDAFCTKLLRENAHRLGGDGDRTCLTQDFRVLDENEATELRAKVLTRALERFYGDIDGSEEKMLLADTMGAGRDDRSLEALVLQFYGKLQSHAYPAKWLAAEKDKWQNIPDNAGDTDFGKELLASACVSARYWSDTLAETAEQTNCDDKLKKCYASQLLTAASGLSAFADAACLGWDAAVDAVGTVAFPRLGSYRGDDPLKARVAAVWNGCKDSWKKTGARFTASGSELAQDMRDMAPAMVALFDLTSDFSELYAAEKLRRNCADFSDQEHFAVRILENDDGTPTETGIAVAERYREIMVDEYQDTNEVQNRIFSAVSRNGKNLFMVGDVKQSIYRFRLADPTIFLGKYRTFPMYTEAAEGEDRKLMLSSNFRSRSGILDAANFVFSNIMSRGMGEMEYTDAEALHFGAKYYGETSANAAEFDLLDYPSRRSSDGDDGEEDAERSEAEARFVAERIRKLIDDGFPVRGEDGDTRPVRQEDIVVLMRSPASHRALYARMFAEQGLTCSADAGGDFFSSMEVAVMYSMLRVVDNPHQDVPLISVLRSPVFGFTPDALAEIRAKSRGGDFFTALRADGGEDAERFTAELESIRKIAPDLSVHSLIWHIYNRFGFLGVFGAMENGDERRSNLILLGEYAEKFENDGYRGLFRFVSHIRRLIECGQQPSPSRAAEERGVRIMSIHKSKGLEFPVVVIADSDKKFNDSDFRDPVLVHPTLGVGPMHIDPVRRVRWSTLARDAVAAKLEREMKAEEMRVLYVAMTRAQEKLIVTASVKNADKYLAKLANMAGCPAAPEAVASCNSYAKWILLALLCRPEAAELRQIGDTGVSGLCADGEQWDINVADGTKYLKRRRALKEIDTGADENGEKAIADRKTLAFEYPYMKEVFMPSKVTATQLKGREIDAEIAEDTARHYPRTGFGKPRFAAGEKPLGAAERGTAMHAAMQFLDFSAADGVDGVRREIERMRAAHLLTDEQADAVDARAIAALMASPLGSALRAVPADKLLREYRFSLLVPARELDGGAASDDKVMLQGAVDCFFEADGALTVVDFKTDRIAEGEESERAKMYAAQIGAYAGALEKIIELPVRKKILYFFATGTAFEL